VLEAKVRVGLNRKKLVDVDSISDVLDSQDEGIHAQDLADRAITLVRNEHDLLPLAEPNSACVIVSSGLRTSSFGQRLREEFRRRAPQARIFFVDNALSAAALDAVAGDMTACSTVIFATFTTDPMLGGALPEFLNKLTENSTPVALVSLGNPYLVKDFPKVSAYMAAFSTATPSEASVVKALFGEIPITGRLPVTIPDIAAYGDGIQLPAKNSSGRASN
jgi:beta-N-acetylhexosaminidase